MRSLNSPSLCSSRHLRNFIFVRATLHPCATCLVPGSWRPFEPSSAARPSRHSSVPSSVARRCWPEHSFDLEAPRSLARLDEPQTTLEGLTGTVVIDEVQRKPDLFPLLRVLADRQEATRYLLLGSASPELVKEVSESLAGRVAFPAKLSVRWRHGLRSLAHRLHPQPPGTRHSRPRNLHSCGDSASILGDGEPLPRPNTQPLRAWSILRLSDHTARRYLEILSGTFMIRLLPPWHANVGN